MQSLQLLLVTLGVLLAHAAVQNTVPDPTAGFLQGNEYLYSFESLVDVYHGASLNVSAQLVVQPLVRNSNPLELLLNLRNLLLSWNTASGRTIKDENLFGDFSRWFSASVVGNGSIGEVHYPPNEKKAVLAFKKSIAEVFVVKSGYEKSVDGDNLIVAESRLVRTGEYGHKSVNKVVRFDSNGLLYSSESDERVEQSSTNGEENILPLLGYPVHSHTTLTLSGVQRAGNSGVSEPENLVTGTLDIEEVVDFVPLAEIQQLLVTTLQSCASHNGDNYECLMQFVSLLRHLSSQDLAAFTEQRFESGLLMSESKVLIDALSHLGSSDVGSVLAEHILKSPQRNDELTSKVLLHFTSGKIIGDRSSVDAVSDLVFTIDDVPLVLQHQALLALGGMARKLREANNVELSDHIVDMLHSVVQHGDSQHERLRRSASESLPQNFDSAILIDSLGNARAARSVSILVEKVTSSHGDLSVKHAAINALSGFEVEESAEALLQAAENSPHPTVQHLAAKAYQAHPRRTRDISHLIHSTNHHRSRRQLNEPDRPVSNVTMPVVSWNRQFGETNISVDISRTLRNSFDIDAGAFTSHYTFSLHDDTSFDVSMLLSGGEQRTQMLRNELCLQGTVTYDINMLTDFTYNVTAHQFNRYSEVVPTLQQAFRESYQQMAASETSYFEVQSVLEDAVENIPSRFDQIGDLLESFLTTLSNIGSDFELKAQAEMILSTLNASYSEARNSSFGSLEALSGAIGSIFSPSKPQELSASLNVNNQPYVDSTFYVPYLPYAPQKALANIFDVYQSSETAFSNLQSSVESFESLSTPYGVNFLWISPGIHLRSARDDIASIVAQLVDAIDTADKSPTQSYDGGSLSEFQVLMSAVVNVLKPGLEALEQVGDELATASQDLTRIYQGSVDAFGTFTSAYEKARSEIDIIFGQKFHPEFPRQLRSCDLVDTGGCGTYPSTSGGLYRAGIDLSMQRDSQVVMPVSGYIQLFDSSTLPASLQSRSLYTSYSSPHSVILFPSESSFNGIFFIISNIIPVMTITTEPQYLKSGTVFALSPDTNVTIDGEYFIHVEAIKTLDGIGHSLDPTQFLQPRLDPQVTVDFECNDLVTYVGSVVVDRRSVVPSSTDVIMQLIGEPLVEGIPGHEFPQPYDLVLYSSDNLTSGPSPVEFFESSTFVMVGPIPVQFDFSSVGTYGYNYSLSANLLSKSLELPLSPFFHARAQGSMRVGSTVFALVDITGTILETVLPLTLRQDFSQWPLVASSTMDIVLVPSTLNLTTQLVQLTGAGEFAEREVLERDTVWEYTIPPLNRDEFYYKGTLQDLTPPVIENLDYQSPNQSGCFVRQLPGRAYNNPAFEIDFEARDPNSVLNFTYFVGSYENGDDLIPTTEIGGKRIIVPHNLLPARDIFFRVIARNLNGLESIASCSLPNEAYYDRSPPLARINPIQSVSSHQSQIRALIVLFDEHGLDGSQEIAIGVVPGENGDDIMPWTRFNTSQITTPPDEMGDVMNLFSFGRSGRLPIASDISDVLASISSVSDCASECNTRDDCFSFDYSSEEENCILHDNIEGPHRTSFENIFYTPELQASRSYKHYEKLGVGNSTVAVFPGLNLEHNRVYYINMRLRNRLGYENVLSSTGFVTDFVPPRPGKIRNAINESSESSGCSVSVATPGCIDEDSSVLNHRIIIDGEGSATVFNGPTPLLDAMYTSATNYITANWNGFSDPESGLYAYTWCVGSNITLCDVLEQRDPHIRQGLTNQESWTNTGFAASLNLSDGSYFVTVQAISNLEYGSPLATTVHHSTPYIIDTSPPMLTEVSDIEYNITTDELSLNYTAIDPGSGIATVSLALGRSQLDTGLLPWTPIDSDGSGVIVADIPDGVPAWVKLRATNNAGLQTIAVSEEAIMVDRSPPLEGRVYDGSQAGSYDDYQSSLDAICVNFEGFSDPESGIALISWAVGRSVGDGSVFMRDLTLSEIVSRAACESGLNLNHNTTYYSTLTVYNGAMNPQSVTVASDGVHIDNTPPLEGYIYDGLDLNSDMNFSSSFTNVYANWNGFRDYESGIMEYVITVYHQRYGSSDIEPVHIERVSEGTEQITLNHFSFSNGDLVVLQIEALNGAGLGVSINSTGYIIDLTPPEIAYFVDGGSPLEDLEYQNDTSSLEVSWDVSDDESGIVKLEGAIFEIREGRRMRIYPNAVQTDAQTVTITTSNTWRLENILDLQPGSKYITALYVTNGAGLRVRYETNGVIVDSSPPVVESLSVSSDGYIGDTMSMVTVITNPRRIELRWSAVDLESGVSGYRVGIVDENGTLVIPEYVEFGPTRGGIVESVLTPGESLYRGVVRAVNFAGEESDQFYSNAFRVYEGDNAGVVFDGEDPDFVDTDYTDEVTAITAHFNGFSSQLCGGISRYEWAIGEGSEPLRRESVLPFTSKGIVALSSPGTGYAQVLLPNLKQYQNQPLFITVRGITGCGGILESTSNGFTIDTSPPVVDILGTGSQAIEPAQSSFGNETLTIARYQNEAAYSTVWSAVDDESGIYNDIEVSVGTYPRGSDIDTTTVSVLKSSLRDELASPIGVPTYLTIRASNGAGLQSVVVSDPVVLDTTPPLSGELSCRGIGRPLPLHIWSPQEQFKGYVTCSWNGVYDFESGISQYAVSIGRSFTDDSSLSKTVIAGKTNVNSYNSPQITFESNLPYYVVLYALNGAGLETNIISNPVYFDLSPPDVGVLRVVPNFAAAEFSMDFINLTMGVEPAVCLWDTDVVTLVFDEPSDSEVGNDFRYEIGVGFLQGSDDISSYEPFQPTVLSSRGSQGMLHHTLNPIDFSSANRQSVFFNIKIYNTEGLYTILSSNAVYVKSYLNREYSWIFDGDDIDRDIDYQTSITEASANFYIGVNCPIRAAQWAVESVDGMLAQQYTQIDIAPDKFNNLFSVSTDQVNLYNNETYRVLVQAVDYSGEVHILRSNGTSVTTAALRPGLVQDGAIPDQDLNYQESVTTLWARWSEFGDGSPEQQIAYYEVAVGSDREYPNTRTDIAPFTDVGLNMSYIFTDLSLVAETVTYYITVRAHAVSGATIESTSNGIVVGFGHTIIPGAITLNRYQTDTTIVSVYWTPFESDLPIRQYEWAIGTTNFDQYELESFCDDTNSNFSTYFEVFGFTNIDLDTTASQTNLNLQHNTTYYVTIRAIDQAKKCISVVSPEGLTIDLTPPVYIDSRTAVITGPIESREFVQEGYPFVIYLNPDNKQLDVSWEAFTDNESGIDYYEVGVFAQAECNNNSASSQSVVIDLMTVGRELEASFVRVNFQDGVLYVVAVQATNLAGLQNTVYSQPIVLDNTEPIQGTVKDGLNWEGDVIYQSDLNSLSAVFTHAKLLAETPMPLDENGPCPNTTFYSLTSLDPSWMSVDQPTILDPYTSRISYRQNQVSPSVEPPGTSITSESDTLSSDVLSGAYRTLAQVSNGGTVRFNMRVAQGTPDYEANAVTAVLFIDGGNASNTIAHFDPDVPDFQYSGINAFGLQIYTNFSNETDPQVLVMWASNNDPLYRPVYVSRSLPQTDFSTNHFYELDFKSEQLDVGYQRFVDLRIDGELVASLHGLPYLSDNTQLVFHIFNRRSYFSPVVDHSNPPTVTAVFGNVSLPLQIGHLCDFGTPFFSQGSPIVEFKAGIGTTPGDTDVRDLESVAYPCIPCATGLCPYHGCETNCTNIDPYEIPVTFNNLTLQAGYYIDQNQSVAPGSGFELSNSNTILLALSAHFQPAVYYITIEATTASGKHISASSNGVIIDVTPPEIVSPIEHFDVSFSTSEPTSFQGNDSVIAARWSFRDPQSSVIEYMWAIGSSPYGQDIQRFESVGLSTSASNENLLGVLEHNTTYYVTVVAINGAGLSSNVSSNGITYLETELNVTELEAFVIVERTEVLTIGGENETIEEFLRTEQGDRAAIQWSGVGEEVREIFWRIGSVRREDDILPNTEVSFNNSQSAAVQDGVLLLNGFAFANISETIALAEGKEEDPNDNFFFFEPGRTIFHSLEFCNFVHRCTLVETPPSILIRAKDAEGDVAVEDNIAVVLKSTQQIPQGIDQNNLHSLDKEYTLTLKTNGLEQGSALYTGFLNQSDITQRYRAAMPYISNPFVTMSQTSREIARRFTEFGGPSFYVSFLGQDSLNAPLEINVTFDRSVDWSLATPEIAYWDNEQQVWREVSATCMNSSRIDWTTYTIAVQVCSTILMEDLNPRVRRQTLFSSGQSGSGSGSMGSGVEDSGVNYLDRPTHFIVMGIGNISTNTAPQLEIPTDPLQVTEDRMMEFQLEFFDLEGDLVDFYLTSSPQLGEATLSLDGMLTYTPCRYCTGVDTLQVYVIERQFGESHTPLTDMGEFRIQINNQNDLPEIYFYESDDSSEASLSDTLYVYIEANRTSPATLGRIAVFDFDGYNDDLQISVTGQYGTADFRVWLDAVNVPESLPLTISTNDSYFHSFRGYVTYLGAIITYLPFDPGFIGTDTVRIVAFDSSSFRSRFLTIEVEVLPSLCQNDGVCGGSDSDPNCTNIEVRRQGLDLYNCSCLPGFSGQYCEIQLEPPEALPTRVCPPGVPVVQCDGDPCTNATCPSHPNAECRPNYCGSCKAEWFIGDTRITQCTANSSACNSPVDGIINSDPTFCDGAICPCNLPPYECPEDSILVEIRDNPCCVSYECVCPSISCPLLMECGRGVQPVPNYRGNRFPGRCCPEYNYEDINECMVRSENLCSDICVDEPTTYSCDCPSSTTRAQDGFNCGVCPYNSMEYLFGDRVKIGCNWCICRGDDLSGERWHCTAETCERGCIRDGRLYPAGADLSQGGLTCSCELTDTNAEWDCTLSTE